MAVGGVFSGGVSVRRLPPVSDERLDHRKEIPKWTGKIEEEIKAALHNILAQTSTCLEIKLLVFFLHLTLF